MLTCKRTEAWRQTDYNVKSIDGFGTFMDLRLLYTDRLAKLSLNAETNRAQSHNVLPVFQIQGEIACLRCRIHTRRMAIANWMCVSWVAYAPGTIAVIEREFNACQRPRSMYPSIFNRFWDIASYWLKTAIFSYPSSVYRPRRGWPCWNFAKILIYTKLEWMGYRVAKKARQ